MKSTYRNVAFLFTNDFYTIHSSEKKEGGFSDSSVVKEFTSNAGDPSLIFGLGRSAG